MTNALIEQSPFEAIQWVEGTVTGVNLNNVSIVGTGTFALQEQTGGAATFTNVTATGVAQANLGNDPSYSCEGAASRSPTAAATPASPGGLQCSAMRRPRSTRRTPSPASTRARRALTFGSVVTGSDQRRADA